MAVLFLLVFVRPDALSLICMLRLVLFVFDMLSPLFGIDVVDIFFFVQKINLDDRFRLVFYFLSLKLSRRLKYHIESIVLNSLKGGMGNWLRVLID